MRPAYHAAVSTGVSLGIYGLTHSIEAATAQWIGGVLIDLDHPFEYWIKKKKERSFSDFLNSPMNETFKTLHLLFHGWEIILLAGFFSWLYINPPVGIAVTIGLMQHLLFDQFSNPTHRYSYFLTYRILNNFSSQICFPKRNT